MGTAVAYLDTQLAAWTRSLTSAEKKSLYLGGTGIFVNFRQLCFETEFLDACLDKWDPELHVFRLPSGELCPLVEEFAVIAGWGDRVLPVVLPKELGYKSKFAAFLGLSGLEVDGLFFDGRVDLVRLATRFMHLHGEQYVVVRRRALAYCLLQRYGFTAMIGDGALGNPRLIHVIEQMEGGKNPAPLILAETLIGLDDRMGNRQYGCKGCPRLLQIWLMERLGVLARLDETVPYHAAGVSARALGWGSMGRKAPDFFRNFVRNPPIRWVVGWWRIAQYSAAPVVHGNAGLMLCGLDLGVWIHPLRLRRQMSFAQRIPLEDTVRKHPILLRDSDIEGWAKWWVGRVMWTAPAELESMWVTKAYERWIYGSADSARLKIEERIEIASRYSGGRVTVGEANARASLDKGKKKMVDTSIGKGEVGVKRKLGESSGVDVFARSSIPSVFDRLGHKDKVFDRLGGNGETVCALKSGPKKKKPLQIKPKVTPKDKSQVEKDKDEDDRDINPKR